jgi:phosphoribosylcarboxyaminoimidazole (NCAIR) mutase
MEKSDWDKFRDALNILEKDDVDTHMKILSLVNKIEQNEKLSDIVKKIEERVKKLEVVDNDM